MEVREVEGVGRTGHLQPLSSRAKLDARDKLSAPAVVQRKAEKPRWTQSSPVTISVDGSLQKEGSQSTDPNLQYLQHGTLQK